LTTRAIPRRFIGLFIVSLYCVFSDASQAQEAAKEEKEPEVDIESEISSLVLILQAGDEHEDEEEEVLGLLFCVLCVLVEI